jgi:hypothetical protein
MEVLPEKGIGGVEKYRNVAERVSNWQVSNPRKPTRSSLTRASHILEERHARERG